MNLTPEESPEDNNVVWEEEEWKEEWERGKEERTARYYHEFSFPSENPDLVIQPLPDNCEYWNSRNS